MLAVADEKPDFCSSVQVGRFGFARGCAVNIPPGLFPPGKRFSTSDIPVLRAMQRAYLQMLDSVRAIDWASETSGVVAAAAVIEAELEAKAAACGRLLYRLCAMPAGARL